MYYIKTFLPNSKIKKELLEEVGGQTSSEPLLERMPVAADA
jgi:hypothetical protein